MSPGKWKAAGLAHSVKGDWMVMLAPCGKFFAGIRRYGIAITLKYEKPPGEKCSYLVTWEGIFQTDCLV